MNWKAAGAQKAFQQVDAAGREHWKGLRFLGVDGVRKTGQAWVKQGLLTATIITPPLVSALRSGKLPPEVTLVEPTSYPSNEALKMKKP